MDGTWTIAELAERAAAALSAGEPERLNGRVRDLPNERLIRWYTTIGLVDPPLGRRGRTALYGRRHLLQVVAVKRRQGAGRALAEIQAELAGATDARLDEIARLSDPAPERTRFWTARPAPPRADTAWAETTTTTTAGATGPTGPTGPTGAEARAAEADEARTDRYGPALVQGVRLSPDLTILLNVHALDADDLAAIQTAARPLLDELHRRGLTPPPPRPDAPPQPAAPPADHPGRST